jgi:hypothetical protein
MAIPRHKVAFASAFLTHIFQIPAEVFPTQYRATCHGISAASGKLGSIIAQVIAEVILNDTRSKRLGYVLIG